MSNVNHPSHYNIPGKKECIEQMRDDMGSTVVFIFCLTNAYKYLYRAGRKDGNSEHQDLEKVNWYLRYAESIVDNVEMTPLIKNLCRVVKDAIDENR